MSVENPFSENTPHQQPFEATLADSDSNRKLLKVLVTIGFFVFFSCCGVGTLLYWGLQGITGAGSNVDLPTRTASTFADDARKFNESLETLPDAATFPVEVRRLVDRTVTAVNADKDLPFNRKMFTQAAAASHLSGGSLGTVERLTIQRSLKEYVPTPTNDITFYRILNVRIEPEGKLGSVDLLTYDEYEQSESHQWFIVKLQDTWEFYDWQQLEFGRRMSDEYAAYVHGPESICTGFDDAMSLLHDVAREWNADNVDEAKRILRSCESVRMLPEDHDEAMLHIAYMWQALDEYEEAIRVIKAIKSPDTIWGAWPNIAVSYTYIEDYDAALEATLRAQKQSPNHPNVQSLLSSIYEHQDRLDEGADAAVKALAVCPKDSSFWRSVVDFGRTKDIPLLTNVMIKSDVEYGWQRLLSEADGSTEWAESLVDHLGTRDDLPAGLLELAQGSLAWSQEDYGKAATLYYQATKLVTSEDLKERAIEDHIAGRMEEDKFVELFNESEDIDDTLLNLIEMAFDDDIYGDHDKLLQALKSHTEAKQSPWTAGLRGWVNYNADDYEAALDDFESFSKWLTDNEEKLGEDESWIADSVDYYFADTLTELGNYIDVIQRWPDAPARHANTVTHMIASNDEAAFESFFSHTNNTTSDSLQVQRARLNAAIAMRSGDAEKCDMFHRTAINKSSGLYEETAWIIDAMIRQRAKDLVWNRVPADKVLPVELGDDESERQQVFVSNAVQEATTLLDTSLAEQWAEQLTLAGTEVHYASAHNSLGELRSKQGDIDGAIDAFRKSYNATDNESSWLHRKRRHDLANALIKADRWDEARKLAKDEAVEDYRPPLEMVLAIASSDGDVLQRILKSHDSDQVNRWVSSSETQPFLIRQADQPWMTSLLKDHPVNTRYWSVADAGQLLFDNETAMTEERLRKSVESALNDKFEFVSVPSGQESEITAWLAKSSSGQRLALSVSRRNYKVNESKTNESFLCVTIEVLDSQPNATKRLFAIARELGDADARYFSWSGHEFTWSGPDIREQLQWQDRVPVGPNVSANIIERSIDEEDESPETITTEDWKQQLEEAGGSIDVEVAVSTNQCTELISAELIEAQEYLLIARPKIDSVLHPLIRAGINCKTSPSSVRPLDKQ